MNCRRLVVRVGFATLASLAVSSFPMGPALADAGAAVALVKKKAAILDRMHDKASKALVNAAQDEAYASLAHGEHAAKERVDKVSLKVQSQFHVEEMCLISKDGPELARIVGREVATDLSPDESGAVFFQPSFQLKPRKAYISPIYMSPDANKLVVAYATPVMMGEEKNAILHYEHGLNAFQEKMNGGLSENNLFLVVVNRDGRIVSDSRASIPIVKRGDDENVENYLPVFNMAGIGVQEIIATADRKGLVDGEGAARYDVAYERVEQWTLIAFSLALK